MSATTRVADLVVPDLPVERYELDCGAQLLVSPRPGAAVTAVEVHLRGGHSLDPDGAWGTAYLTGALLDQGTAKRSEEEIAERLELAGGGVHGASTGIAGNIASAQWRTLLDLVCELITSPRFPRTNVLRQKQRLLDRLAVDADDPRVQCSRLFRRQVYGNHWLGRRESGEIDTVATIERKHLAAFHRKNWCASRALIAVCGGVRGPEVLKLLNRGLADWKRGRTSERPPDTFPKLAPRAEVFRADRQQVHVTLGHLGIRRSEPDYPALVVMDHILGTGPGFTNRIPGKLRDELGLAYSVSANLTGSAGVLPGTFHAYIGTAPEHVDTAVRVFLEEIRRIQGEPPSDEELDLAVRYVTGSMAMGFERAASRARYLIFAERNELGAGHLREFVEHVATVTPEEVRAAAAKHLHPDKPNLAIAGPLAKSAAKKLLRYA